MKNKEEVSLLDWAPIASLAEALRRAGTKKGRKESAIAVGRLRKICLRAKKK